MQRAPSVRWTREHSLIALNLYCKVPFGRLHRTNPIIVQTAAKMGRTANSLAMKLVNFASLDPVLRARGVRGLPNVSQQDRAMWQEFQSNLTELGEESEQLIHDLFTSDETKEVDFLQQDRVRIEKSRTVPTGATERTTTIKVRRGQQFFRQSVLIAMLHVAASPASMCRGCWSPATLCRGVISQMRDLITAMGFCLSALHDAAFDAGLITVNESLQVVLSKRLTSYFPQSALEQNFVAYDGAAIRLPEKLAEPAPEFLRYHRERVFLK